MENLISYLILVNLWLIIGILFYKAYLRKRFGFQYKRFFLLSLSLLPFLLCIIKLPFQSGLSIQHTVSEITIGLSQESLGETSNSFNWLELILTLYGFGVLISFSRLLGSSILFAKQYKNARGKEGYLEVPNSKCAFSVLGHVYLGAELDEKEKAVILNHERIHVKQLHFIDLLLSKVLEIIFFFNPLVYKLSRLMQENHEFEADQLTQVDKTTYLNILLQQHFQTDQSFLGLTHSFNTHHLKNRIMNLRSPKKNFSNRSGVAIACLLFLGLFSFSQFIQAESLAKLNIENQEQEDKKHPEYPGGNEALMKFMVDNIKYPESAKKEGISGTVFVKVIVANDGNIADLVVLKKIDERLANEAIRVFKMMPKWKPAKQDGKAVKGEVTIPVKFAMSEEAPKPPKPPKAPEAPPSPN
ncbi:MAG: M56 family metallopeptidase [Vicingaceae bacterium]